MTTLKNPRKKIIIPVLLILIILALMIFVFAYHDTLFDREALRSFIENAGVFGPLILIAAITVEVIVAPIPGGFFPVLSGFLFGLWLGWLYAYIGAVLGSFLAFSIARFFGYSLVRRLVEKEKLEKVDGLVKKYSKYLFIFYIFPIFPVDIISFVAGFSSLPPKRFFAIITLSFISNIFILSFFGSYLFEASFEIASFVAGFIIIIILLIGIIKLLRTTRIQ